MFIVCANTSWNNIAVVGSAMAMYLLNQRRQAAQAEEKRLLFDLIEKITGAPYQNKIFVTEYDIW